MWKVENEFKAQSAEWKKKEKVLRNQISRSNNDLNESRGSY